MKISRLLLIEGIVLAVAAAMTIYAMLHAAAWSIDLSTVIFIIWALSPYVSFFAASRLIGKLAPLRSISVSALVISVLMLAFTVYAYLATMNSVSSTSALVFVFIPLYLYIGAFFLFSISILLSRVFRKQVKQL